MAFSLIASTAAGSVDAGASVTTAAINTTGANLLVAAITRWTGGTATLTDSKGNTWTALTENTYTTVGCRLYYCVNPTVGTGHTFSESGTTTYATLCVAAFASGATSATLDQSATNGDGNTFLDVGPLTPSTSGQLIITALGFDVNEVVAINSGFTITNQVALAAGQHEGGAMAYLIQGAAAAVTPRWSWTSTTGAVARMVSFQAVAADPPPPTPPPGGRGRRRRIFLASAS